MEAESYRISVFNSISRIGSLHADGILLHSGNTEVENTPLNKADNRFRYSIAKALGSVIAQHLRI